MTRSEFLEISTFSELDRFCYEHDIYEILGGYIDGDNLDDEIWNDIGNANCSWYDLGQYLTRISTGYDFYYREGWLDYSGYDNNDDVFTDLLNEALDYGDENNLWDAEDESDEEDESRCDEDLETQPKQMSEAELWWGEAV